MQGKNIHYENKKLWAGCPERLCILADASAEASNFQEAGDLPKSFQLEQFGAAVTPTLGYVLNNTLSLPFWKGWFVCGGDNRTNLFILPVCWEGI